MSDRSEHRDLAVRTSAGVCRVRIGPRALTDQLAADPCAVVVADRRFASELQGLSVIGLTASESAKTLSAVEELLVGMSKRGVRRGDHVVAIGGGVVQDVVTLAASIYMRGINWSYAPTTLMSMADSCLGGKSSINAGGVKNLVGNIYPPQEILIEPRFTATLDQVGVISGLAEAAKIAFCRGPEVFARYVAAVPREIEPAANFGDVITVSLEAKRWFVERDEFDRAERRLLNFGHTFGHALEVATDFRVPHGIAVGLGMLAAIEFRDDPVATDELTRHVVMLIRHVEALPSLTAAVDWPRFTTAFDLDKKHSAGTYRVVLPAREGGVGLVEVPADDQVLEHAASAMRAALDTVGIRE